MVFVFVVTIFTALASCKTANSGLSADFVDAAPTSGQTYTQARLISLGKYAKDLLNYSGSEQNQANEQQLVIGDWFKEANINNAAPLSSYTISLGSEGECFSSEKHHIYWGMLRDRLKSQIEQVSYFIRDFHYMMLGHNEGMFSFKRVILCPEAVLGEKMVLEGYNLKIGLDYSGGRYQVILNKDLKALWKAGYPIGLNGSSGFLKSMRDKALGKYKVKVASLAFWKIFNPLSPVRQGMRKAFHSQGVDLSKGVSSLLELYKSSKSLSPENPDQTEDLQKKIQDFLGPATIKESLKNAMMQKFKRLSERQQVIALENIKCLSTQAADIATAESVAMGVVQNNLADESNDIEKEVRGGLVAITNHHRVNINFNLSLNANRYSQYIDQTPQNRKLRIKTKTVGGLVAVDTSDDINVNINLDFAKSALPLGVIDRSLDFALFSQQIKCDNN